MSASKRNTSKRCVDGDGRSATGRSVWHFSNAAGDEEVVTPSGPLRVTNSDALVPTVLAGTAIAELPEFIASEYLADGRLEAILTDWTLPRGALYFVTPSARSRPAKVEAVAGFMAEHLSYPSWLARSSRDPLA